MKRLFAGILSLILCLGLLPCDIVHASEVDDFCYPVYTQTAKTEDTDWELTESEEVFAAYAEQVLYGTRFSVWGTAAGRRLSGNEKILYDALVPVIKEIAAGKRESTIVAIGRSFPNTPYQAEIPAVFSGTELDVDLLLNALLADLPYELYWQDKTLGFTLRYIMDDNLQYVEVSMHVSGNYSGEKECTVNTDKTGAAEKAARKANSIVSKYADQSDYEKLLGYKKEICDLVSYDYSALGESFQTNNDPWQLIHVFDGNSETNVVCEGYAKAFMYLCDLTKFHGDVSCYIVGGGMNGKNHMWNIVTLEGKNYLVDVTNSESDKIGFDGSLFMAGASGSATRGYWVNGTYFAYDICTQNLWGTDQTSILTLAESGYVPEKTGLNPPKIEISGVSSSGKNKISWDAVAGAAKYMVYRATSKNGTYSRVTTTTKTSYTNTSAKAGTKYYYYVVAVDTEGNASEKSNKVSRTCDLEKPAITVTNVASSGKIKVSWEKVEGAKEYKVYRATSKTGTYKLVKTTMSTGYTNTSTEAGKTYYYKVKAIHENGEANSAYSGIKSRTCDLARPDVSIKLSSKGKPSLSWKKIADAKEYKIYRAASKDGKYSLMKTTASTSYTNTSAVKGKTYYYKVVAVHTKSAANSAYSLIDSIKSK